MYVFLPVVSLGSITKLIVLRYVTNEFWYKFLAFVKASRVFLGLVILVLLFDTNCSLAFVKLRYLFWDTSFCKSFITGWSTFWLSPLWLLLALGAVLVTIELINCINDVKSPLLLSLLYGKVPEIPLAIHALAFALLFKVDWLL